MAWAAKKNLQGFAITVLALTCISIALAQVTSLEGDSEIESNSRAISCFNETTEVTETFTTMNCPENWVSLGEFAITRSDESATAQELVHPILEIRFRAARAAASAEGVDLYITSGFRTIERQDYLFAQEVVLRGSESEAAKWVLPGRYSHHPKGLALDINYPNDPTGAKWLEQNGYRFGLCRVYENEWWHFEAATAPGLSCPPLAPNALVDLP